MRQRSLRGQVMPFLAVIVLVAGVLIVLVARFGAHAVAAAQSRTAADAAALAGAAGGESEARAVAKANGGRIVRFERVGLDVRVHVEVKGRRASARARADGFSASGSSGPAGAGGLAPALRAAIARAEHLLGARIPITSGYRSPADQARLYARRATNPFPVAPPGSSMHEKGLAIDVPRSFAERLAVIGPSAGLCRPYPRTDPIHFELCASRPRR